MATCNVSKLVTNIVLVFMKMYYKLYRAIKISKMTDKTFI